mmetsp:Transcript_7161/g.16353  ORF Transcript_7161/g.16353 Transcript_7161/m.16353 type:complete len:209 (-) Transcript_7161:284-910(-)
MGSLNIFSHLVPPSIVMKLIDTDPSSLVDIVHTGTANAYMGTIVIDRNRCDGIFGIIIQGLSQFDPFVSNEFICLRKAMSPGMLEFGSHNQGRAVPTQFDALSQIIDLISQTNDGTAHGNPTGAIDLSPDGDFGSCRSMGQSGSRNDGQSITVGRQRNDVAHALNTQTLGYGMVLRLPLTLLIGEYLHTALSALSIRRTSHGDFGTIP